MYLDSLRPFRNQQQANNSCLRQPRHPNSQPPLTPTVPHRKWLSRQPFWQKWGHIVISTTASEGRSWPRIQDGSNPCSIDQNKPKKSDAWVHTSSQNADPFPPRIRDPVFAVLGSWRWVQRVAINLCGLERHLAGVYFGRGPFSQGIERQEPSG